MFTVQISITDPVRGDILGTITCPQCVLKRSVGSMLYYPITSITPNTILSAEFFILGMGSNMFISGILCTTTQASCAHLFRVKNCLAPPTRSERTLRIKWGMAPPPAIQSNFLKLSPPFVAQRRICA
eukprot:sb/3475454/